MLIQIDESLKASVKLVIVTLSTIENGLDPIKRVKKVFDLDGTFIASHNPLEKVLNYDEVIKFAEWCEFRNITPTKERIVEWKKSLLV